MSTYTACLVHFIVMKYYLNTNKSLAYHRLQASRNKLPPTSDLLLHQTLRAVKSGSRFEHSLPVRFHTYHMQYISPHLNSGPGND